MEVRLCIAMVCVTKSEPPHQEVFFTNVTHSSGINSVRERDTKTDLQGLVLSEHYPSARCSWAGTHDCQRTIVLLVIN